MVTVHEAADKMNVGARSVKRPNVVLDKGTPELINAVDTGNMSVTVAAIPAKGARSASQALNAVQYLSSD